MKMVAAGQPVAALTNPTTLNGRVWVEGNGPRHLPGKPAELRLFQFFDAQHLEDALFIERF
jgi:hypothetical protein